MPLACRMLEMKPTALVRWFRKHGRSLPWRREPRDPYQVVVSEFMLQQTQVDRVAPRFESFVDRFPSFEALAGASQEEVLAEWSGLGYYRRARMLHQLARQVASRPGGLPRTVADLLQLRRWHSAKPNRCLMETSCGSVRGCWRSTSIPDLGRGAGGSNNGSSISWLTLTQVSSTRH